MPRCNSCKEDKPPEYFLSPQLDPGHNCRLCKLLRDKGRLVRHGVAATDEGVLAAVKARQALVDRTIDKKRCANCGEKAYDLYNPKTGLVADHWWACERLYTPSFIGARMSHATPLCVVCSTGNRLPPEVESSSKPPTLQKAKRIAAYWRRRAQRASAEKKAAYWRATYFWDAQVREAITRDEQRQARELDEKAYDALPVPWFEQE